MSAQRCSVTRTHDKVRTVGAHYLSNVDAESWEPFDLGDGRIVGEVHWLRSDESEGAELYAGVWRVASPEPPPPFRYEMALDETIHVLEGELHLQLEGGPMLVLAEGDIASFESGTSTVWTLVRTPFKEVFVLS